MIFYNGKQVMRMGTYRSWHDTAQDAYNARGIYGQMDTGAMDLEDVKNAYWFGRGVMDAHGAVSEYKTAIELDGGLWTELPNIHLLTTREDALSPLESDAITNLLAGADSILSSNACSMEGCLYGDVQEGLIALLDRFGIPHGFEVKAASAPD